MKKFSPGTVIQYKDHCKICQFKVIDFPEEVIRIHTCSFHQAREYDQFKRPFPSREGRDIKIFGIAISFTPC